LGKLLAKISFDYPQAVIAGSLSPKFGDFDAKEIRRIDSAIRESHANIVWVGLGTPKQDYEATRISQTCNVPAVAVGAAFDFLAGTKNEAPQFLQGIGLEWLYRLLSEPRRLWRRYLIGNLQFLVIATKQLLGFFK
jgi:N-acetylglucosaminyldiphosphoundecaprenol N-acetyl-beta-D-mannosaminyltransferase